MKNDFKKVFIRFFLIFFLIFNLSHKINSFEPLIPYKTQIFMIVTAGAAEFLNLKNEFANLMLAGSYLGLTWLGYKIFLKRKNRFEKES